MSFFSEFKSTPFSGPAIKTPPEGFLATTVGDGAGPSNYNSGLKDLNFSNGVTLRGIEATQGSGSALPPNTGSTFYILSSIEPVEGGDNIYHYLVIARSQTVDEFWGANFNFGMHNPIGTKPTIDQVLSSRYFDLIDWSGHVTVQGSQIDDVINTSATSQGSTVHGWRGSDIIIGGTGDDLFTDCGITGDRNVIQGGGGTDTLNYTLDFSVKTNESGVVINGGFDGDLDEGDTVGGIESLHATEKDDNIRVIALDSDATFTITYAGDDKVYGMDLVDVIDTGQGNDKAFGGAGNDGFAEVAVDGERNEIDGGVGVDHLWYGFAFGNTVGTIGITINGGVDAVPSLGDTVTGIEDVETTEYDDNVRLLNPDSAYNEWSATNISTLGGNDKVRGTARNDRIDGGAGNDEIQGADGNDEIQGADGDDTLDGDDAHDTIDGGGGEDEITGGDGADDLFGNTGNDSLVGGAGIDVLDGGAGEDTFVGGDDLDVVTYANGPAVGLKLGADGRAFGDAAGDLIGESVEIILGSDTSDEISLGNVNRTVYGGGGSDKIWSSSVGGTLYGDFGANFFFAALLRRAGIGGIAGDDKLFGKAAKDTLSGGDGDDKLYGGGGNDILFGDGGKDELSGIDDAGEGANVHDELTGGAGKDEFWVDWHDHVKDFQVGEQIVFATGEAIDRLLVNYDGTKITVTSFNANYGGEESFVIENGFSTRFLSATIHETFGLKGVHLRRNATASTVFEKLSTDGSRTKTDYEALLNSLFNGLRADLEGARNDALNEGIQREISGFILKNAGIAATKAALTFFKKLNVAETSFDVGYALGEVLDRDIKGEFTTDGARAAAYAGAVLQVLNPLANTTEAAFKLGRAAAADAFEATIRAAISPLVDFVNWLQKGTNRDDFLQGGGGPDFFYLKGGDDIAMGQGGSDTFVCGSGAGDDLYDGGSGNDSVYFYSATKGVVVDLAKGSAKGIQTGTDELISIENVYAGPGADTINGNGFANELSGGGGQDRIDGRGGNDLLAGGSGRDTLVGGSGRDSFLFDTKLSTASNVDTIIGFAVPSDTIRLENGVFKGLALGNLPTGALFKGPAAHDFDDHIIYNKSTGALFFDANGSKVGGGIQFALLAKNLPLTADDFIVV